MGAVASKKPGRGSAKRPPSPADEADARALDMAVESMIEQVLSGWNHSRPLGSLNRDDLRKLATAAICGFIVEKGRCDEEFRASGNLTDAEFAMPI